MFSTATIMTAVCGVREKEIESEIERESEADEPMATGQLQVCKKVNFFTCELQDQ